MSSAPPKTLLFVCTGNTCRSPMAERLAASLCAGMPDWHFASAGVFASPGEPASPLAVDALRERGIPLEDHKARALSPNMVREADHVVAMTAGHRELIRNMAPDISKEKLHLLHGFDPQKPDADVMDPFGGTLDTYRMARDDIESALSNLILALIRPPPHQKTAPNTEGNTHS
ncbi:MAG: low molecular weight protein arginine phosphatase [Verrucomicrobia bacterium]|nr:low molecular weight protein arginine phosphatase [Verrucomicrobiota bacterium]MCH8513798.1 low molecular weight protein arginine phosphatase [Kiritimatiellia bacterium]